MRQISQDELKRQAAERAADFVEDGMIVGLGHGSTAIHAVRRIAALIHEGALTNVRGVPCSNWVEAQARSLGIPLISLDEAITVDLTIDGADEVDPALNVIKGGGGALLREKCVAQASRREIIVVDESKCSPRLGTHYPVPMEVLPFAFGPTRRRLEALGANVTARLGQEGEPFLSDQGNLIVDGHFGPIADTAALARELDAIAGVLGHGLFLGLTTDLVVAGAGGVKHTRRSV